MIKNFTASCRIAFLIIYLKPCIKFSSRGELMFFVNKELLRKLLDFKDEKDLADEFNDLDRIELAIDKVEIGGSVIEAELLTNEIYNKYPTIESMLKASISLPMNFNVTNNYIYNERSNVINKLQVDCIMKLHT